MTHMPYTMEDIKRTGAKKRDAWWTVFVVDPVAAPIALFIANRTKITPNQITVASFALGLGAAASFAFADYPALVLGALLYHLSFVLDCVDGKVARLKDTGSIFGGWLDYILDRVRVFVCAIALMGGQFVRTGQSIYLYLAVFVVFLEMLRNLNALRVNAVRKAMLTGIRQAIADHSPSVASSDQLDALPPETRQAVRRLASDDFDPDVDLEAGRHDPAEVIQQHFQARFGRYTRLRDFLQTRRVRTHIISGIEFQMATFIIGPLTSIIPAVVITGALLLVFEFAIIYKLWLSTKDYDRIIRQIRSAPAAVQGPPPPLAPGVKITPS
jgi:phosphatidylglycerophosphate synthase